MTILVAPDSFKGTHDAAEVAAAIARGIRSEGAAAVEMPVADGGEGTLDVLAAPLGLRMVLSDSVNPWRARLRARWGLSESGVAVVELARTCGLNIPHAGTRDPRAADTYGVGLQIVDALAHGATEIIVAAGGSATTDGGLGAVAAIEAVGGLGDARITVLSDVRTRYSRAAAVFGPQKGASAEDVRFLTRRLDAARIQLPRDPESVEGSGAAGGLVGALWAHYDASIVSGARYVLDALDFAAAANSADAVVVGEGRLDAQTAEGKIIAEILLRCGSTPVHAIVGSCADHAERHQGFADVRIASTIEDLYAAGGELARSLP